MEIISLKKNEKKILKFIITDKITGNAIPLTDCVFTTKMQMTSNGKIVEKSDGDFDKTDAGSGIVKITLEQADLDTVGRYEGQLNIVFSNGEIDKSNIFTISVSRSIV